MFYRFLPLPKLNMANLKIALTTLAKNIVTQSGPVLLVVLGGGALIWWMAGAPWKKELGQLVGLHLNEASVKSDAGPRGGATVRGLLVELSPEKLAEAKVETVKVIRRRIRPETIVPGRVDFDATKRLNIVAPVDCVVERVLIQPGASVSKGEHLVILQSGDVGLARDQIGKCEDELKIAARELEYAKDILANVQDLLAALAKSPEYESVVETVKGKRLGIHREHLLSAYSKLNFARKTMEESTGLGATGAVSGRLVQQRKSEQEIAAAAFESQCETSLFECLQEKDKAQAAAARAERMLEIAKANLNALLGGLQVEFPTGDAKNLSELIVTSPLKGQIEAQIPVRFARLKAGDSLLTVADASDLWITANVREREWNASRMKAGDEVKVKIPAVEKANYSCKVRFSGAEVSPTTRTLPVVLEIENPDGLLKPGMSAWASLAVEDERDALLIPTVAVLRHEDQPFVFVREAENRFRRVDIQIGYQSAGEIEVLNGVSEGEEVVTQGAFLLKSELLLEKEE